MLAILVMATLSAPEALAAAPSAPGTSTSPELAPQDEDWFSACAVELERICRNAAPLPPRACLSKHEEALSDACWRAFIKPGRFGKVCFPDLNRHCKGGPAGLPGCLTSQRKQLTAPCRAFLDGKRVTADGIIRPWTTPPKSSAAPDVKSPTAPRAPKTESPQQKGKKHETQR
jgi:hypothetical protein